MHPLASRPNTTPWGRGDDQRLTKHPLTVHDTGASTSCWRSRILAALGLSLHFDISLALAALIVSLALVVMAADGLVQESFFGS